MSVDRLRNNLLQRKSYRELAEKKRKNIGYRVGRMVIEARMIKNFTQEDLATRSETSQPAIARLESGLTMPSLRLLVKIAAGLGTYLIPPRFAFMKEIEEKYDLSFVSHTVKTETVESENFFGNSHSLPQGLVTLKFNSQNSFVTYG